jgi:hypothetical protein
LGDFNAELREVEEGAYATCGKVSRCAYAKENLRSEGYAEGDGLFNFDGGLEG